MFLYHLCYILVKSKGTEGGGEGCLSKGGVGCGKEKEGKEGRPERERMKEGEQRKLEKEEVGERREMKANLEKKIRDEGKAARERGNARKRN